MATAYSSVGSRDPGNHVVPGIMIMLFAEQLTAHMTVPGLYAL